MRLGQLAGEGLPVVEVEGTVLPDRRVVDVDAHDVLLREEVGVVRRTP
jgi:hypothetical protein